MHTGQSNKIIRSAIVAAWLSLITGMLAAQDVKYNFMPGTDFSKFHTYKWVVVPNATYPNQIVDTQIKDAINSQLSAKGLTLTDSDKADLYVAYQTSVDQQKQWNAYGMGGGWRFGGGSSCRAPRGHRLPHASPTCRPASGPSIFSTATRTARSPSTKSGPRRNGACFDSMPTATAP